AMRAEMAVAMPNLSICPPRRRDRECEARLVFMGQGSMQMSDVPVTARARRPVSFGIMAFDGFDDVGMAFPARVFGDAAVAFGDLDGVGVVADGKVEGMPEAVLRLGGVFSDETGGRVAVVAGGDAAMAALDPA